MTLTFAETHNLIAYLSKSDASEGFNQIIDFLNGSSIKYALTVNPNIYVSCIKQFWTTVAVKKVNDVTRLQALVDKMKVVVMKAKIRDALCLDDAEGVKCLPNEEIFAELAKMGYEKPSTKLTFYKVFFSSQWKFLIHTSILVRNVDSPTKFYMYPRFLQLMIRKQVGDISTNTTKYTSPALTQKEFANMRRVENVNVGDDAEGDVSAANDEVPTADEELSIPSPTPPTPPPQLSHDIPSPSQDAGIPMNLLQEVMDTRTALTSRVKHLELDKIAQALEITKLKKRVKKLERRNKENIKADMDADADVILEEAKEVADNAKDDQDANAQVNADIQGRTAESQAEIYKIDLDHANKIIIEFVTAASTTITAADVLVPAATIAAAPTLTAAPKRRT
nr:xylulose kinase-1 [Tanacetum cinerariifolium]